VFKSFSTLKAVSNDADASNRARRVFRNSQIIFSDSTGPVIAVIGIRTLRGQRGNSYKAAFFRITSTRVAIRIFNQAGTGIATYVGNSTGSGDEIEQMVAAAAGSEFVKIRFIKNSSESFSASINFADATSFRGGAG
jgi:hypothetical protein